MDALQQKLAEPSTWIGTGQSIALAGTVAGTGWVQIASLVLQVEFKIGLDPETIEGIKAEK